MKPMSERPTKKLLYIAIATALTLGTSIAMSSHAQEGDTDPNPILDVDIVLVETPGGDELPGELPDVGELPEEIEPLPTLPEGIALDNDGNAYPEGGPAGLYNAIVDKQQKLGMTGIYDADGNLVDVIYEGGNYGQQNALSRLRANLERKLNKDGLGDDGTEVPEIEPLPEEVVELAEAPESPDALDDVPTDELAPALAEGVAFDSDGNAYPEGGPAGLYNAITDKQQKVGMEGVYDVDGNLESVSYEGGNSGQQNALSRLRANLERKLKKLGLFDETPEVPDTVDLGDTEVETLSVSAELGISSRSEKVAKVKVEKSQKPEKAAKVEKVSKVERVERVERPQKATKVTRVERPQRPEKISRVEKPQRPEKIARVEKPQRPEKIQKPEKPQKPVKPERPGRS
ncbi:MAG: hypothetical protein KAJ95_09690 [Gammaproteobacteria bacterium]|nr:hypothetical protein [Gammaproteobacteria bacterium]